jgi:GNAT superfamily N-acetyltransferase
VIVREARREDLLVMLTLMADGQVSSRREVVGAAPSDGQAAAFAAIAADPHQVLACGIERDEVVAMVQLTFIPGLSRDGAWRMQLEGLRVRRDRRGEGLGRQLLVWALDRARDRGCAIVQLTSDASRSDAHRFYTALGFEPSHVGFKLRL